VQMIGDKLSFEVLNASNITPSHLHHHSNIDPRRSERAEPAHNVSEGNGTMYHFPLDFFLKEFEDQMIIFSFCL
jgi:hypothetical protein